MKTIKKILEQQYSGPVYVSPDDTIYSALELMARYDIGAVMVFQDLKLVGIFSERDYARKVILLGKSSKETLVKEIMTERVLCSHPDQTIDEAMSIMSKNRIRHLPVLSNNQCVIGMVSIGDLVKETMADQEFLIKQLEMYIAS